jgi:hypothetical protein
MPVYTFNHYADKPFINMRTQMIVEGGKYAVRYDEYYTNRKVEN